MKLGERPAGVKTPRPSRPFRHATLRLPRSCSDTKRICETCSAKSPMGIIPDMSTVEVCSCFGPRSVVRKTNEFQCCKPRHRLEPGADRRMGNFASPPQLVAQCEVSFVAGKHFDRNADNCPLPELLFKRESGCKTFLDHSPYRSMRRTARLRTLPKKDRARRE